MFTIKYTLALCALAWLLAGLIVLPNFIDGVGGNVYDTKTLQCIFNRLEQIYTITVK